MNLSYWIITPLVYLLSFFPMWVLHLFSTALYFLVYRVLGYRRKVVRQNIERSFPDASPVSLDSIERKFYRNFCDLLFEVVKMFSISSKELLVRCRCVNPEVLEKLYQPGVNLVGISSHLGNWEWLAQSIALAKKHQMITVYKPLSNQKLGDMVVRSRERFGSLCVPIQKLRKAIEGDFDRPFMVGLLADQAPHNYDRAFEVSFLSQKTYVVLGPALIALKPGFVPVWGWIRRVGRSRYEWGVEEVLPQLQTEGWSSEEQSQIQRIADQNQLPLEDATKAFAITKCYSRRLEQRIQATPEDWLWSHRRWKSR